MDREIIRENFGGKAWGVAALLLVLLNGIVLVISVQVLGSSGIDLHFAHRDRLPRSTNIYMGALACSALVPIIVGIVALFVDKRKTAAGWAGSRNMRFGLCSVRMRCRVSRPPEAAYVRG